MEKLRQTLYVNIAVQFWSNQTKVVCRDFLQKQMQGLRSYFYKQHQLPFCVASRETLSMFCNYCPTPQHNMFRVVKSVPNI